MFYSGMTIKELQSLGVTGDSEALTELGRKVLDYEFDCEEKFYCPHKNELEDLEAALNEEIPPDCPKCGQWLTNI